MGMDNQNRGAFTDESRIEKIASRVRESGRDPYDVTKEVLGSSTPQNILEQVAAEVRAKVKKTMGW